MRDERFSGIGDPAAGVAAPDGSVATGVGFWGERRVGGFAADGSMEPDAAGGAGGVGFRARLFSTTILVFAAMGVVGSYSSLVFADGGDWGVDVAKFLSLVRVLAYALLIVGLAYVAICEYNGHRLRRAGLFGLTSCYYGIALLGLVWDFFDPAGAMLLRMLFTPILVLQAVLAVWVWWRPSPGQTFRSAMAEPMEVSGVGDRPVTGRGIGFRREDAK